ncbi:AAA family ATPase [Tahibacter harae]|uniref:ATP-binding protein n=1 Tax=Tahibacter harae TaxID=2963937 RepID=A0ABT1QVT2_9GAMM|nr:AAA family ATPase [Tahibacter harae]MCQ4166389.1 ATP-binding protein [Tahibacter harae]
MPADKNSIPINIVGFGVIDGANPVVIVGPNGAGKSQTMRSTVNPDRFISAQRKTFLSDRLSAYSSEQLANELAGQYNNARNAPWAQSNEVDALFSGLIGEDYNSLLRDRNVKRGRFDEAASTIPPKLEQLVDFWEVVFPEARLTFSDFAPRVYKVGRPEQKYPARAMSDGERACLYLAARILTTSPGFIVIDEPELHLHRRLAVNYWNELERLRPDLRFVYITHDLNFALSRSAPTVIAIAPDQPIRQIEIGHLSSSMAAHLLGAATLTTNANRFVFFEGTEGSNIANRLMQAWIKSAGSVAIPAANLRQVVSATRSLSELPIVANAKVEGLVDRDHGPNEFLATLGANIRVLDLHEIESVLAIPQIVRAVAGIYGRQDADYWEVFLERARKALRATLPKSISDRARARIDQLLYGSFTPTEIRITLDETRDAHAEKLATLDLSARFVDFFEEERLRVSSSLETLDTAILIYLSGKIALNEAAIALGVSRETYVSTVLAAVSDTEHPYHQQIVQALAQYLPDR